MLDCQLLESAIAQGIKEISQVDVSPTESNFIEMFWCDSLNLAQGHNTYILRASELKLRLGPAKQNRPFLE